MKKIMYIYGWIFVRPRRWFFWKCDCASELFLFPIKKEEDFYPEYWEWPNLHWWILNKTLCRFLRWCHWDGHQKLARTVKGRVVPNILSRLVHKISQTCVEWGYKECYHCGFGDGEQVGLSSDETGKTFVLEKTWTESSEYGTGYGFSGHTICPVCGYKSYFEDSSL